MNHIARTRRGAERSPGLVIMGIAVLAFVVCVVNFALGAAGAGVVAASVGLLAFGAGLAWLVMDGRRFRDAERDCGARRPAP
ncbi:hypothetical protein AWB90_05865 [Mycobacterium paraense]|uniref:UsfY protein n=1 Tax=Mycobacterium paraense TaxID=767916 RepID=A0A1X2AI13_9MYCO|nr:hypothetical protein [Mycobacterium paraense]ORW50779.1 hypothetical protein AWB90_05865 [Mycobacterium paraense]